MTGGRTQEEIRSRRGTIGITISTACTRSSGDIDGFASVWEQEVAIDLGQSVAANPIIGPKLDPHRIVSTAPQQAVFTDGKVDVVPTSILIDTGSAVTIVH